MIPPLSHGPVLPNKQIEEPPEARSKVSFPEPVDNQNEKSLEDQFHTLLMDYLNTANNARFNLADEPIIDKKYSDLEGFTNKHPEFKNRLPKKTVP